MRRIAIDYTAAIEQGGGIGRYVRELTAALARVDRRSDYRLFVAGAKRNQLPTAPGGNFSWRPTVLSPRWLSRIWHRARLPLPIERFTGSIDLLHATDFTLPPSLPGTRTLLTVHDLSFLRAPEATSPPLKRYLDAVVPRSVRRADHVLADSKATRSDLIALYNTPAEKITVLYSGVDRRFQPVTDFRRQMEKYNLVEKRYALSVGTVTPRKNYSRVIRALSQLGKEINDLNYVIVGGAGWTRDEIDATIAETGMRDRVHFLGFVPDADLPALYTGARMLILASLYEGFGLPILEAMACGTPVIAGNVSSLPEVVGDAGLLVDPSDIDAISGAIHRLENDDILRQRCVAAGIERARAFTWERAAAQLQRVYQSLLD